MRVLRLNCRLMAVSYLALIVVSCGTSHQTISPGFELPWPPPAASRDASDMTLTIAGRYADATGGTTEVQGNALFMTSWAHYSWGIYTATGFQAGLSLAKIELDAVVTPVTPGDATRLYVGLANYARGTWEWYVMDPGATSFSQVISAGADYVNPAGSASIAAVIDGGGDALLSEVRFFIAGEIVLPAPENLSAVADVDQITLDWDDVPHAAGYNVYRSTEPEFPDPVKLNTSLVLSSHFIDGTCGHQHRILYYKVSAVLFSESELSDLVDIYTPQTDLPLPGNPRVDTRDATSARVAWDWSQGDPAWWDVYLSTKPDFSLTTYTTDLQTFSVLGFMRNTLLEDLQPGVIYYWRVVARISTVRGRMTNDNNVSATGFWLWEFPETVGTGSSPIVARLVDNDISIAYFDSGGIKFARRSAGSWDVQDTGLNTSADSGGFVDYIDLAYANGKYVIPGYAFYPGDLWVAEGDGTAGGWSAARVDGDGDTGTGHTTSGMNCHAAINSTDIYVDYYDNPVQGLRLAVRPIDGTTWTKSDLRVPVQNEPDNSLGVDGETIAALVMDSNTHELLYGDSSDGFASLTDIAAHPNDIGMFCALTRYGTDWWTPAYDPINRDIYVIHGNPGSWQKEMIDGAGIQAGQYAKLAWGDSGKAYMIYKVQNPSHWMLAVYDGAWDLEQIMLTDIGPRPALAVLGDTPYIIYQVMGGTDIVCTQGTPPS